MKEQEDKLQRRTILSLAGCVAATKNPLVRNSWTFLIDKSFSPPSEEQLTAIAPKLEVSQNQPDL